MNYQNILEYGVKPHFPTHRESYGVATGVKLMRCSPSQPGSIYKHFASVRLRNTPEAHLLHCRWYQCYC